jgi:hypothetical protein
MTKFEYTYEEENAIENTIADYHRWYEKVRRLNISPIDRVHGINKFNEMCRLKEKQMLTMKKRFQYAEDCLESFWVRPKVTPKEFREEFEDDKKLVKQILDLVKTLKEG